MSPTFFPLLHLAISTVLEPNCSKIRAAFLLRGVALIHEHCFSVEGVLIRRAARFRVNTASVFFSG